MLTDVRATIYQQNSAQRSQPSFVAGAQSQNIQIEPVAAIAKTTQQSGQNSAFTQQMQAARNDLLQTPHPFKGQRVNVIV